MISITEAAERLAEIVEAQSRLIEKLIDAVGQFDEFENEVKKINEMKEDLRR
jgi:hypothetical protein|nr:MAG TPA: hypothetical protein [Caudoviricetes sp.]